MIDAIIGACCSAVKLYTVKFPFFEGFFNQPELERDLSASAGSCPRRPGVCTSILGMSKAEIAAAGGVGRSRICCSFHRGLAAMKNILKKSL